MDDAVTEGATLKSCPARTLPANGTRGALSRVL